MITNMGKDGRWCATAVGDLGKTVVADGETLSEAMNECLKMLEHQKAECYAWEQAMSHLSLTLEGEYDETRY